jgi:hypothetical protein
VKKGQHILEFITKLFKCLYPTCRIINLVPTFPCTSLAGGMSHISRYGTEVCGSGRDCPENEGTKRYTTCNFHSLGLWGIHSSALDSSTFCAVVRPLRYTWGGRLALRSLRKKPALGAGRLALRSLRKKPALGEDAWLLGPLERSLLWGQDAWLLGPLERSLLWGLFPQHTSFLTQSWLQFNQALWLHSEIIFLIIIFFSSTGVWILGFTLAKQVLCPFEPHLQSTS